MVTRLSYRITAITMALMILLSSTGLSMDIHFCQDNIKSISFFGKAQSCHDKEATPACHKAKKTCKHSATETEEEKNNCCHNEALVLEKSDFDATSPIWASAQDIQFDFIAAFVAVYIFNYDVGTYFVPFAQYKPPLPDKDIQVLFQAFLI